MAPTDTDFDLNTDNMDLTNCDREPIHVLGHVQSYGCLIAITHDWIISHASANVGDYIDATPDDLIGTAFSAHFAADVIRILRTEMQTLTIASSVARIFAVDLFQNGRLFDVSVHSVDRSVIFELEPKSKQSLRDDMAMIQPLLSRIRRHTTTVDLASEGARAFKALTGFDRVMMYRFEQDDSGTVIAEALEHGMEPFLNLRFPASDIPKQARALYKKSLVRLIADVDDPTHAIVPQFNPEGKPLDLSLSITRAVSPIHLEYLRNMGVAASMSVSIIVKGELWGLIACHHQTPHHVDYERRSAVELMAQMLAYELMQKEQDALQEQSERAALMQEKLLSRFSTDHDIMANFDLIADEIESGLQFDGIVIFSGGIYKGRGAIPTEEEFLGLARFLNTASTGNIFATDALAQVYPKAQNFSDRVAGVLALPVSRTPRDYIVLFRREIAQSVKWAGNPQKPVNVGPNGTRLTPRQSFKAWQEIVHGRCNPWTAREFRTAESMRVTLLEVVLKLTDEMNLARKRANEQQELLIAELNHRVRNILNLIRGLVSQSRANVEDIEEYTRVLGGRVLSLARAHEQLTAKNWTAASFRSIVEVEVAGFLDDQSDRIHITGEDVRLNPEAYTTVALVVHELVTNAVKYGALSIAQGEVSVSLFRENDGITIQWTERSGPPVKAPDRRGFGSTIIQKSIPFELRGTADVRHKVTGLEATFWIPSYHLEKGSDDETVIADAEIKGLTDVSAIEGNCLLVEDNMIIGLDASDMLSEMGVTETFMANTVARALKMIETEDIRFALLDVNLGTETSLPVAEALVEQNIPFVLTTGYGDASYVTENYPPVPILNKPYEEAELQAGILRVLKTGQS